MEAPAAAARQALKGVIRAEMGRLRYCTRALAFSSAEDGQRGGIKIQAFKGDQN